MKKTLLAVAFWLVAHSGFAQNEVMVQSNEKGMFVPHTVSPKENFYSIGRLYAISPKEIAAFNGIDMANGLSVGQVVNIPLTSANFSQTSESGTPVYYQVGEKEGLYRVSVKNNKVQMASLRKWNRLASDNISTGQKLIVGYIQASGVPPTASAAATTQPVSQPATPKTVAPAAQPPVAVQQKQPEPKRETPVSNPAPVASTPKPTPVSQPQRQLNVSGSGYFKNQFELQSRSASAGKDLTVNAGVFKTTSGWQDGKYYALMDGVEPGTIIRLVNPTNSKVVFAKVLGEMSGIRQNAGLDVRISSAAATALEVGEQDKFVVRVNY